MIANFVLAVMLGFVLFVLGTAMWQVRDLVGVVIAIVALLAMVAVKARIIPMPDRIIDAFHINPFGSGKEEWDDDRAVLWAAGWGLALTALGALGAFFIADSWWSMHPGIEHAYYSKYGPPACAQPSLPPSTTRSAACVYGAGWNVIKRDGPMFWIAATLLLATHAHVAHVRRNARMRGGWRLVQSLTLFLSPIYTGAVVFLMATHGLDWVDMLFSRGVLGVPALIPQVIPHVISAVVHEVTAPIVFLQALASHSPAEAVQNWVVDELIRINGSFYRLGSLYPKMLMILILGGIVQYAVSLDAD